MRAKTLSGMQPTLSPLRNEGRAVAATLLRKTLSEEHETQLHIARLLRVSPELIQRWTDPNDKRQFPVGDLVAVALAGSANIVYAYLDELARHLFAHLTTSRTPIEHAYEISRAANVAAVAVTESDDRATRVRALRALSRATNEAISDLSGPASR